jgi:UDP-N-acetylglucosamine diphosphorylase/glucosamine-1-phosphate N-acetyltransferase
MHNYNENVAVIILAAGMGTRMKSDKAKVLHTICNKPMINYVVETAVKIAGRDVIAVVGHQADMVRQIVSKDTEVKYAHQKEQLGTGHATMCAIAQIPENIKDVIVLCGDVPNLSSETILNLIDRHKNENNDATVLAVEIEDPHGYGRIIVDGKEKFVKIVEESDANEYEKTIKVINSGIYCVDKIFLENSLTKIKNNNAQNEYYLTDIIEIGNTENKKIGLFVSEDYNEVIGVNSHDDLLLAEKLMERKNF